MGWVDQPDASLLGNSNAFGYIENRRVMADWRVNDRTPSVTSKTAVS